MHSNDDDNSMKDYRNVTQNSNSKGSGSGKEGDKKSEGGSYWKNKSKQAMETPNFLKTAITVLHG